MILLTVRSFILVVSATYLLNALLPTSTSLMTVENHSVTNGIPVESYINIYQVDFKGKSTGACSVTPAVYSRMRDGDVISVESSRIFGECVKIEKDEHILYHSRFWKLFNLIIGMSLAGIGLGLFKATKEVRAVSRVNE